MNIKEAKEIVKHGVIPGDIDSYDLAEAKGFVKGHSQGVEEAIEVFKLHQGNRICGCDKSVIMHMPWNELLRSQGEKK